MKQILLIAFFGLISSFVVAQQNISLSFEPGTATLVKSPAEDKIYKIPFRAINVADSSLVNYKVNVKVNHILSTLPPADYQFDFKESNYSDLQEYNVIYFTLKKDNISDRDRKVVFEFDVKDSTGKPVDSARNSGTRKHFMLTIKEAPKDTLSGFNYLAYVGTNFDLVDGIKASNLFFAANVFSSYKK